MGKWQISSCWKSLLILSNSLPLTRWTSNPPAWVRYLFYGLVPGKIERTGECTSVPGSGTKNSTSEVSSRSRSVLCIFSSVYLYLTYFLVPLNRERFESRFWLVEGLKSIRTSCRSKSGRRVFKELGNEPVAGCHSPLFFIFRRALLPVSRSDHGLGSTGSYGTPNFPLPGGRSDRLGFIKVMLLFKTVTVLMLLFKSAYLWFKV